MSSAVSDWQPERSWWECGTLAEVSEQGIGSDNVNDVTVRNHSAQQLVRARFTDKLFSRFDECVEAIDEKVSRITMGQ